MSGEAWGFVFLMLALKLPIVYLVFVVWYAFMAEPEPDVYEQQDFSNWRRWRRPESPRPRRGGPHGSRDSARVQRARRDKLST
jgi:hypothetical protein